MFVHNKYNKFKKYRDNNTRELLSRHGNDLVNLAINPYYMKKDRMSNLSRNLIVCLGI